MTGKLMIARTRLWLVLLICLTTSFCYAQANSKVSASVQPAQVTVGDVITYSVSIEITGSGQPSVAIPVIDPDTGLSTPTPAGTQNSMETYIVNGNFRSVQHMTYNYTIRASKEGKFTIPASTVTINGKTYDTAPVKVEVHSVPKATNVPTELEGLVVAPNVSGNPELQRKLTGVVFILPVVSNTTPYNGEQVRVAYHLVIDPKGLAAAGLMPQTNLDGIKIPPMNEFIAEELYPFPQDIKFQERKIGGKLYLVAPIYDAAISSTKSGKLTIDPFQISMLFSLRNRQGRSLPSPFANDPFFSTLSPLSMMGGNSVQVIAQSPPLTFNVKPLPETGRPADFAGAVGDFKITAEVDKKSAKAYDETIDLDVTVSGKGNTASLSPPTLPDLPGFTVLGQPEQKTSGHKENDDYISVQKFSYSLRPTTTGKQVIPPIELSYFEPGKEKYNRIQTDPIPLEIKPGSNPAPLATAAPSSNEPDVESPKPAEPDLRYISTARIEPPNSGLKKFHGIMGLIIFLIPPGLLAVAGGIAWTRNRSRNKELDKRRLAKSASAHHLKEAHDALQSGQTKLMMASLADGIRLHFAAQLGISASESTIPEIEDRLRGNGAPEDVINGLCNVLENCDSAQYSPSSGSQADARATYNEAMDLLKRSEEFV